MFGEEAIKLVKEFKRNPDTIIPNDGDLVRSVQNETRHLFTEASHIFNTIQQSGIEPSRTDAAFLAVASSTISRNKRCLLAYHHNRMKLIMQVVFHRRADGGGSKPAPKEIRSKLSAAENQFYKDYARVLNTYRSHFLDIVDVTGSNVPPASLLVRVRAVKDVEFDTGDGKRIKLKAGHADFVKRQYVEQLVEQGLLVHVQ